MDKGKEAWIMKTATLAETAVKNGQTRWDCIRKLQMVHAGRRAIRNSTVYDENGLLITNPKELQGRWFRHFQKVLNLQSDFRPDIVDQMDTIRVQLELDEVPSKEELKTAMQCWKLGKAGGKNGIMPELVAFGGEELQERLLQVISDVWGQQVVVSDWREAEVIPITKKGKGTYMIVTTGDVLV